MVPACGRLSVWVKAVSRGVTASRGMYTMPVRDASLVLLGTCRFTAAIVYPWGVAPARKRPFGFVRCVCD